MEMETLTLDYADADVRKFVYSRDELAFALGCSVRKVAELMKVPGCPGRLTNGSYPLPAWKKFYREFDPRSAESVRELEKIRLRERAAKAQLAELLVRERIGDLVRMSAAVEIIRAFAVGVRDELGARMQGALRDAVILKLGLDNAGAEALAAAFENFRREFCASVARRAATTEEKLGLRI